MFGTIKPRIALNRFCLVEAAPADNIDLFSTSFIKWIREEHDMKKPIFFAGFALAAGLFATGALAAPCMKVTLTGTQGGPPIFKGQCFFFDKLFHREQHNVVRQWPSDHFTDSRALSSRRSGMRLITRWPNAGYQSRCG